MYRDLRGVFRGFPRGSWGVQRCVLVIAVMFSVILDAYIGISATYLEAVD